MRVLIVEHGALVSGGQRSLLELLAGLPSDVEVVVACPDAGPLHDLLRQRGVTTAPLAGTVGSFKLHPLHTPRMVLDLGRMAWRVRRHAARLRADVVHANSVRAGLVCALAFGRRGGQPRVVVHLRDSLPINAVGRLVRRVLAGSADALIAISHHTADNFGSNPRVHVVHNGVDLERFHLEGATAAFSGSPLLAVIGQITPWKGQDDAIEMLARLREKRPGARLLIVGETKFVSAATRYDNRAYEARLLELVRSLGLSSAVEFLGEREDVPEIMRACDLVLAPSWEEPFGRTVIEALATGTPVVATDKGGPPEILAHGGGVTVPPCQPHVWAQAVDEALGRLDALRSEARSAATVFATSRHVERVIDIYRLVLD